jgi:hypothetical protein
MSEIVEVSGDTIYVIDRRVDLSAEERPFLYDTIDWLALAKQKRELVGVISLENGHAFDDAPAHPLDGLLGLIDHVQDDAEAMGYPVVYGYDLEMYKEDHPNTEIPDGEEKAT